MTVALVAGIGGGAYLWKEAFPTGSDAASDGGQVPDASADARASRGKPKVAKRGGRPGASRAAPKPALARGGNEDGHDNEGDNEEVVEEFRPPFRGRGPAGPTYEAAIASNRQEITMGRESEPDLTDAQLSGPMHGGSFVGECGAPDSTKVTVKVAVKQGRPVGVSVSASPPDADVAGCIDRYVRTFSWPSSSKMDSFTTTY